MNKNKGTIKKVWKYIDKYRFQLILSIILAGFTVAQPSAMAPEA